MSYWQQYTSPLGYVSDGNSVDTYGVDHSGFTTRDELAYQTARMKRENDLMTQMDNQGITNYPQYTTNFWGTNADNNYGFGTSNIESNIQNMQMEHQPQIQSRTWETATDGKQVYDDVIRIEGDYKHQDQNAFSYDWSVIKTVPQMLNNYLSLKDAGLSDKYKHAYINCNAAQNGKGGTDLATIVSGVREWNDLRTGANTLDSSQGDQYANKIGRLLGGKYPNGDCDDLVQKYIQKYY